MNSKTVYAWRTHDLKQQDGILVGCNERQEWLLPWWWENYRRHNDYPVTFVDFGLSFEMKEWCRARGELVCLEMADLFVKDREEIDAIVVKQWEDRFFEAFWESRKGWFKKPFACLLSPYLKTLWIDLDCEILGPLQDLFVACEHPSKIALVRDQAAHSSPFPIYNSGVIAFQRNHPLILEWAKQSVEENGSFPGDQDLLSKIIWDKEISICEMPSLYNWSIGSKENKNAVILHWLGEAAKTVLQNKLILEEI